MAAHDVLTMLRDGTAEEHRVTERALDLLDPRLTPARLGAVLVRMHGFWTAADAGLDAWAAAFPGDAEAVAWPRRRRAHLFAADLAVLGAPRGATGPALPIPIDTDE